MFWQERLLLLLSLSAQLPKIEAVCQCDWKYIYVTVYPRSHWYIVSIYSEGDREEKGEVAKIAKCLHISGVRERGGSRGVRLDEPKLTRLQFVWEAKHVLSYACLSGRQHVWMCLVPSRELQTEGQQLFFVFVIPWRRARAWFWVQSTLTLGKCCASVSHHYFRLVLNIYGGAIEKRPEY